MARFSNQFFSTYSLNVTFLEPSKLHLIILSNHFINGQKSKSLFIFPFNMTIMIKLYIPNDSYSSEIFTSHTLATIGIKWSLISPTPNFSSHLNNTLSFSFSISQPSLSKLPALQKMYFSVINGSYSGTELSRLIIYIRQTVVCEEWRGSGEGVLKKK